MKNWVTALDSLMTSLWRGIAVFLKVLLFQTLQRKISSLQFVWFSGLEVSCFRQGSLDNDGHDWVNTFERVQSLQSVYGNVQRLNVIYSHRAESRLCDAIFPPFVFIAEKKRVDWRWERVEMYCAHVRSRNTQVEASIVRCFAVSENVYVPLNSLFSYKDAPKASPWLRWLCIIITALILSLADSAAKLLIKTAAIEAWKNMKSNDHNCSVGMLFNASIRVRSFCDSSLTSATNQWKEFP